MAGGLPVCARRRGPVHWFPFTPTLVVPLHSALDRRLGTVFCTVGALLAAPPLARRLVPTSAGASNTTAWPNPARRRVGHRTPDIPRPVTQREPEARTAPLLLGEPAFPMLRPKRDLLLVCRSVWIGTRGRDR